MRRQNGEPRHVCIVLLSGIGDVIHGLPVVNAMRDRYPSTRVTWVVEPAPAQVLQHHPSIDNIVLYRREDGVQGIRKLRSTLRQLGPFDLTLNFNIYFKSIWPTLLSRAPRRIGFDRARSSEGVWLAANERLAPRRRAHTADMFMEFAEHLGFPAAPAEWRLTFTEEERSEQRKFFDQFIGRPVATVIPASATHKKDWIASRWARVIDALSDRYGFHVVMAGGPGDRERTIAREIVHHSMSKIVMSMGDSVRRLMWIIQRSSLVIAPDTGPVHIARAMNVPVIGLYGHTNPWRVGPWRAFEDLWVDHYTDPLTGPDPSNRKPKWEVMDTIQVPEVNEKIRRAVIEYDALRPRRLDSTV